MNSSRIPTGRSAGQSLLLLATGCMALFASVLLACMTATAISLGASMLKAGLAWYESGFAATSAGAVFIYLVGFWAMAVYFRRALLFSWNSLRAESNYAERMLG